MKRNLIDYDSFDCNKRVKVNLHCYFLYLSGFSGFQHIPLRLKVSLKMQKQKVPRSFPRLEHRCSSLNFHLETAERKQKTKLSSKNITMHLKHC